MPRVTDSSRVSRVDRGFTLVEMIISIVISGVVLSMVGMFGRRQIEAYMDVSARAELADAADTALRRIGRDLQSALPNSVRMDAGGTFLEYVPIVDSGRYRADVGDSAGGNDGGSASGVFNFGVADSSFQVLGPDVDLTNAARLVVFNLGIPGSDVYEGSSSSPVSAYVAGTKMLNFTSKTFNFPAPQNRFQLVGTPVTYQCAPPYIYRHKGYGFLASVPTSFAGSGDILVSNVESCTFSYTPAVLQRNGMVVLKLKLTHPGNNETISLLHQVEVLNTP